MRTAFRTTACAALLAAAILALALWYFGSLGAAAAWAAGEPYHAALLRGPVPEEGTLRITNLRGRPLEIFGVRTLCNCAVIEEPRRVVPPRGRAEWRVRGYQPLFGDGTGEIHVFTDAPARRTAVVAY